MALTAQVKDELARVKITRTSARKAEVSSIFRFSSALHLVNGSIVLEAELDTAQAAKRLRSEIKDLTVSMPISSSSTPPDPPFQPLPLRVTRDGEPWPVRPDSSTTAGRPVRGSALGHRQRLRRRCRGRLARSLLAHGSLDGTDAPRPRVTCPAPRRPLPSGRPPTRTECESPRSPRSRPCVIRDGDDIAALLTRRLPQRRTGLGGTADAPGSPERLANRLANFDDANLRRSARRRPPVPASNGH